MQRLSAPWPVPNDCACSVSVIPKNSQLLRAIPLSVNVGTSARTSAPAYQHAAISEQAWGVPFSPNEFKQAACNAGHPKLLKTPLPQHLQHAIDLNKKMNPNELLEFRERWFQKWEARAKQLEPQEDDLKQSLPEHLREILKSKRLLLWKELLHDIEYEDQGVFDEVVSGTDLTGQVPLTGIFPQTFKPAATAPEMVRRDAQHTRTRVISGVKSQGCVDKQGATPTRHEVEAKWASDAVPLSELDSEASISRRFGLTHGSGEDTKTRLIDDLSDSAINKAVQVCESPQPHTTDVLACLLLECLESFPRSGLSGRSYNLKAAYRQLGLSKEALKDSYVAFHDHESSRPAIHQLLALPFGATRSVHSFLRVTHSVWALGCSIAFRCTSMIFRLWHGMLTHLD